MTHTCRPRHAFAWIGLVAIVWLGGIACSSSPPGIEPGTSGAAAVTPAAADSRSAPAATDAWSASLQRTPYPFTTPLPPAEATVLDGVYTKVELKEATPFPCRRCADYRIEGGTWKLQLDRGIYRMYHEITGWLIVGSYTVTDDRIQLFNDPVCTEEMGVYEWAVDEGGLTLTVIEDACATGRRAENLTNIPWHSCQPPNDEAAISAHWKKPPGC